MGFSEEVYLGMHNKSEPTFSDSIFEGIKKVVEARVDEAIQIAIRDATRDLTQRLENQRTTMVSDILRCVELRSSNNTVDGLPNITIVYRPVISAPNGG